MRDLNISEMKEDEELKDYELSMKLFAEVKEREDFSDWFMNNSRRDDKKVRGNEKKTTPIF